MPRMRRAIWESVVEATLWTAVRAPVEKAEQGLAATVHDAIEAEQQTNWATSAASAESA